MRLRTAGRMMRGGAGPVAALFSSVAAVSLLATASPIGAQETGSLARLIAAAPDGTVRFHYPAREGICGDGHGINIHRETDDVDGRRCEDGPVWVEIEKSGSRVTDLDMWVGRTRSSRDDPRTDLGATDARQAADYLLGLARGGAADLGDEAVGAAALADVEVWPELLEMARDAKLDTGTRESAIFWLAQQAGDRATEDLEAIVREDGDSEVRQAALFGLSQLPEGAGFDSLVKVVRENDDPELVQVSLFWLGQTGDPRAISLFEEILARP